jgi:hypothetical protein
MKKTVLVYDDESQIRIRWKRQLETVPVIKSSFVVTSTQNEFRDALSDLEQRRRRAREKSNENPAIENNVIDKASVLIVDFDLFADQKTGEDVAYLARCYSRCGMILGVNQFGGDNPFDLTLRGHPESFADINLGGTQISNDGLWQEPWSGFRPWAWPLLINGIRNLESQVDDLLADENLDKPVLKYLGFGEEVIATLPRSTREFLGSGDKPQDTTFRKFVLESANGVRPKDNALSDEFIARIAAARISKWLERLVLPGQDILVDAPHLVSRYPSLLAGNRSEATTWNQTTSFLGITKLGLHHQRINKYRFEKSNWLSRPTWLWRPLTKDEKIKEVSDPWSLEKTDYVFCEDISKFVKRGIAREFVAELPSPFVRRFVVNPTTTEGRKLAKSASEVDYIPAVRFTL